MKFGLISLGCAKNRVDSEEIISLMLKNNFELCLEPSLCDVIIINTCGFIQDSKKEAIDTIFEMLDYHKITVVVGCLVQRYKEQLEKEIPEVDLFISIREYDNFIPLLNKVINQKLEGKLIHGDRYLSTPSYTAFLRISEGCNNCCAYCAIPLIRGSFHSFPFQDLIDEAKRIAETGVKELVVISQDTTRYGSDLKTKTTIVDLLKELLKIEQFSYIRLLYLYPDEISDELIDLMAKEERLTPYFDIPIQHSSSKVLESMGRRGNEEFLRNLFTKIRNKVPKAILRTTLIVGYPSETEEEFNNLVNFVKEIEFDHLGVFTYSKEDGTKGGKLKETVSQKEKEHRKKIIMEIQQEISKKKNQRHVGEIMKGIVTSFDEEKGAYLVRSYFNAPDEIDGNIYLFSQFELEEGELVEFKIVDSSTYDLFAEIL